MGCFHLGAHACPGVSSPGQAVSGFLLLDIIGSSQRYRYYHKNAFVVGQRIYQSRESRIRSSRRAAASFAFTWNTTIWWSTTSCFTRILRNTWSTRTRAGPFGRQWTRVARTTNPKRRGSRTAAIAAATADFTGRRRLRSSACACAIRLNE